MERSRGERREDDREYEFKGMVLFKIDTLMYVTKKVTVMLLRVIGTSRELHEFTWVCRIFSQSNTTS